MKRAIVVIAVLFSIILSSCYARVQSYNDGMGNYKHYRRGDRHSYEKDRTYKYKDSYYRNHREGTHFR